MQRTSKTAALLEETRTLFVLAAERIQRTDDFVEASDILKLADDQRLHADRIRDEHLDRIKGGTGHALAGLTFSDMIVALRRIKNHTVNMIDAKNSSWERRRDALRVFDVKPGESVLPPRTD